jgi:hypothetical protein
MPFIALFLRKREKLTQGREKERERERERTTDIREREREEKKRFLNNCFSKTKR